MDITSIRFFYNGFKVNNGPLIKAYYSLVHDRVEIQQKEMYAESAVPGILFHTFDETSSKTIEKEHNYKRGYVDTSDELYPYVLSAYHKSRIHSMKAYIQKLKKWGNLQDCERARKELKKFEKFKDAGQPGERLIKRVLDKERNQRKELMNRKKEEERKNREKEEEESLWRNTAEKFYIEQIMKKWPVQENEVKVTITFSENAALNTLICQSKDEKLDLSLEAAFHVFDRLDSRQEELIMAKKILGYEKTWITVSLILNGREKKFEDRYDIGSDGGLRNILELSAPWAFFDDSRKTSDSCDLRK